jgi:hypothetical protein
MKKIVVAVFVSFLLAVDSAHAQDAVIKFPPGSAPAIVKSRVNPLSSKEYKLTVSADQRIAIHLSSSSRQKLVKFTLRHERFTDKTIIADVLDWQGTLKAAGEYWISVFALPKANEEDFTLEITEPANNDAPANTSTATEENSGEIPALKADRLPLRGNTAKDFVIRGWKLGEQVSGDLNGDGISDQVVQLESADTPDNRSETDAAPAQQALLVLFSENGKLRRAALANRLLVLGLPQYSLTLKVRNDGVLSVSQDYGMSDVTDLTHLFRYDAASGRLVLIGREQFNYTRPLHDDTIRTSENYLTGVRLITTGHSRHGVTASETTKRELMERKKVYFEDVNETTQ